MKGNKKLDFFLKSLESSDLMEGITLDFCSVGMNTSGEYSISEGDSMDSAGAQLVTETFATYISSTYGETINLSYWEEMLLNTGILRSIPQLPFHYCFVNVSVNNLEEARTILSKILYSKLDN